MKPSEEKLLFQAADAGQEAVKLARQLWDGKRLDMPTVDRLAEQARRLHCAAVTLQNRTHGHPEPKIGG